LTVREPGDSEILKATQRIEETTEDTDLSTAEEADE